MKSCNRSRIDCFLQLCSPKKHPPVPAREKSLLREMDITDLWPFVERSWYSPHQRVERSLRRRLFLLLCFIRLNRTLLLQFNRNFFFFARKARHTKGPFYSFRKTCSSQLVRTNFRLLKELWDWIDSFIHLTSSKKWQNSRLRRKKLAYTVAKRHTAANYGNSYS